MIILSEEEIKKLDLRRLLALHEIVFDEVPSTIFMPEEETKKELLKSLIETKRPISIPDTGDNFII